MSKIFTYFYNISGTTAIEYVLIASGVSLAIVGALFVFGNDLNNLYALLPTIFG